MPLAPPVIRILFFDVFICIELRFILRPIKIAPFAI